MGSSGEALVVVKRPVLTPKALLHQKFGKMAHYRIEEVQESAENICPGLTIPQPVRSMYKCHLELPDLSVTSETFSRKKDAEQSAAKLAIDKLGIQAAPSNSTPQDVWVELVQRISCLFSNEFLSSSHPLNGHFKEAFQREGGHYGFIPLSVIVSCDLKTSNLCKSFSPSAESDPAMMISLVMKAARSLSLCIPNDELWIGKKVSYSEEIIHSLIDRHPGPAETVQLEAILIPYTDEKPIEMFSLAISPNQYYLDEIASKLSVRDSSRVLISRPIGRASSEMRLYFPAPEVSSYLDSSVGNQFNANGRGDLKQSLNKRASYLSGQNICGDAILAVVGYTWRSSSLLYEHVLLSTYYRMLASKVPAGNYKLSTEAIFAAELPTAYTTRSNWRGPLPRDLLSVFCRQHLLSEPIFDIETVDVCDESPENSKGLKQLKISKPKESTTFENGALKANVKNDSDSVFYFRCELKILTRKQELMIQYSCGGSYRKHVDAIQNASLEVLSWLNKYFSQPDISMAILSALGQVQNIHVDTEIFSREFELYPSVHGADDTLSRNNSYSSIISLDESGRMKENEILPFINGPDSDASPSNGSLVCVSYVVNLVSKDKCLKQTLETRDEFEFEVGTGSVIHQLEACIVQMSVNQSLNFMVEVPSRDIVLAGAGQSAKYLSQLSLCDCFLEYSVRVLRVTEPLEDRMEQALFSPPLSKQRVEFAVRFINDSQAKSLVDFGCGSGSLLDSILDHKTTLEKVVGVDISVRGLTRAAKIIQSKISSNDVSLDGPRITSAVLYDGSITTFDSRLSRFDIGTCLEVIEHMELDQADLFGELVLSSFSPRLLIVSTPNYEYNPILQRSSLSNKEEDPDEKSQSAPCKFRNHDHKFEWTREQFEHWATGLASKHNYGVEFSGVGGSGDVEPGFASQIAIFRQGPSLQEEELERSKEPCQPYEVIWEWNRTADT